MDHPAGPVKLFCTQTLGHHGGGRSIEGDGYQQSHVLYLGADPAGRGGLHPVGVDKKGHRQPGQPHHRHLHRAGNPQLENLDHLILVERNLPPNQAKQVPVTQHIHQADHKAGPLGKHRGQGRAPHAPSEAPHKQTVQRNVAARCHGHTVKGLLGVAHRAEHGRQGIVSEDGNETGGTHLEIGRSLLQRRRPEGRQNGTAKQEEQHGQKRPRRQGETEHRPIRLDPVGPVLAAKILPHENVAPGGNSHDNLG